MRIATTAAARWVEDLAQLVGEKAFDWDDSYIESALDSRDGDPFDSDWVDADRELELHKASLSSEDRGEIEELANALRKRVFSTVLKATGSSDLAGYVSDDFELVCAGLASKFNSKFMYSIVRSYMDGRIPDNVMVPVEENPSGIY